MLWELLSAAAGGGLIVEIVRRMLPTRDKQMELRDKREAEIIDEATKLREALWEEVHRLSDKVKILETQLDQATQIISTLRAENIILKAEVEVLKRKSDKSLIVEEGNI